MKNKMSYSFVITFIWLGFVCAISFVEAPIKFTAPSLNLEVGLDVGRHVFAALNIAEWIFALLTLVIIIWSKPPLKITVVFLMIFSILLLQTFWLLPGLNERVVLYIKGIHPPSSNLHIFYIAFEFIKVIFLAWLGILQINNFKKILISSS